MRERHLCTTFKLRTNSFLLAEGGVRSFDKSDIVEKNTIINQFFVKLFLLSFHLSAFEVTFIKASNLSLCRQKGIRYQRLYTNDALSSILFQPIAARLFPIATPFPAFSILAIPLDKCQIKSFENINILIEVKLFCLKNAFFEKDFHLKEKIVFERKKKKSF